MNVTCKYNPNYMRDKVVALKDNSNCFVCKKNIKGYCKSWRHDVDYTKIGGYCTFYEQGLSFDDMKNHKYTRHGYEGLPMIGDHCILSNGRFI